MPIYICWYESASTARDVPTTTVTRARWSNEVTQEAKMAAKAYQTTERPKGWVEVED